MSHDWIRGFDVCLVSDDEICRIARSKYESVVFLFIVFSMFFWSFSSKKERTPKWYIFALIVVLFLIIYGITEGMYLMSIASFLFAGVYVLLENNSNPIIEVKIDDHAIRVNTDVFEFSQIQKFAILSHENVPVLLRIFLKKSFSPVVDIPFTTEVDAYAIKDFLTQYIEIDDTAELSKSDHLINIMKL